MAGPNRTIAPGFGVGVIGFVLLVANLVHVLFYQLPSMLRRTDPALLAFGVVELLFLVLPPVGLVYAGFRIVDRKNATGIPSQWTIAGWCALGAVSVPVVIGAIKVHQYLNAAPIDPSTAQLELLTGAGGGGVLGLVIGLRTERALRYSRRVREQQEAFVFLDKALRHHVLNSLNVVNGYAQKGRERLPEDDRDVLDPVIHRSETIVALIKNVGRIAETYTGELVGDPIDVVSLLAEEIESSRLSFGHAEFDTVLPDRPVFVRGNGSLRVVFENVLTNAVVYNDLQSPSVRTTVEIDTDSVTIWIEDDGPGIPANERGRLFEPRKTGASGFGLYLAREIVEYHRGSISIGENEPRGTVVTVRLPRASADPE